MADLRVGISIAWSNLKGLALQRSVWGDRLIVRVDDVDAALASVAKPLRAGLADPDRQTIELQIRFYPVTPLALAEEIQRRCPHEVPLLR